MEMRVILIKNIDYVSLKLVKEKKFQLEQTGVHDHHSAIELLKDEIGCSDREVFAVVCLNSKGYLNNLSIAHVGTLNQTLISNREIFKVAVKSNASSIIVAHNHPSGDVTPSEQDIENTKLIVKAGELLGINLLDHIIISDEEGKSIRNYYPHIFE